ncbi:MAG: PTS sugar transporter subunit IIA [Verrucomicrobia bacterium]|nr:PTS sugar transporter subunit IIA [Verrucomicrobiota bacterium]
MTMPHRVFTLEELAAYLHLDEEAILLLAKRNEIPHEKLGSTVRFRRHEIDRWASQRLLGMDKDAVQSFHKKSTAKHHDLSPEHALIPEVMQYNYIDPSLGGKSRAKVIRNMVDLADNTGMVWDLQGLLDGVEERENLCSTALSGGVALLHPPQHEPYMFEDTFLVLGRTQSPIPFGGPEGRMTWIFFLICSQDDKIHLHLLARLSMICHRTDALLQLTEAETREEMYDILVAAEQEIISNTL